MQADDRLLVAWAQAHADLGLASDPHALQRVLAAWKGEGRCYHGPAHLRRGLQSLAELGCDAGLAVLAWFFHDAVYVVGRRDNEARSAQWFCDHAEAQGLDAQSVARGAALILMTADHQNAVTDDPLWPVLNDVDLAVFASDRATYDRYAEDVWFEYEPVMSRREFVRGRASFMSAFATHPIFLTQMMKPKEAIAHVNIDAEVARLREEAGLDGL